MSRIIDSSQVTSDSDPPLSHDSILIKWCPMSDVLVLGNRCWQSNHTMMVPGGVFLYWLVSVSSEEITGFIVKGLFFFFFCPLFLTLSLFVP